MSLRIRFSVVSLGLPLLGLLGAIGCESGATEDKPIGEGGSESSGGSSGQTGSGSTGSGGKMADEEPAKESCCRPGELCEDGLPLCATVCPGKDWACAAGELCSQQTDGKYKGCSEDCPGSECGSVCCAPGASCSAKQECVFGDLSIKAENLGTSDLSTITVDEDSCGPQEGCVTGTGERAVAKLNFTVKNVGKAAVDIGEPWDSPLFFNSRCSQQYLLPNFVQAEVLSSKGKVVASGHLPTSCVSDVDGVDFHCSAQGLSPGEESEQPQGACNTLDLTGLLSGEYKVRLTVNPSHRLAESDFTNNTFEIDLNYPECEGSLCGGICCPEGIECKDNVCQAPDIRPHKGAVEDSLIITRQAFGDNSCEIAEACIGGPGKRRLLNFESRIENLGPGDLDAGEEHNNPLFEFSQCHGHNHFLDFTDYRLLTPDGEVVTTGHKQAFCLLDMERVEDYVAPQDGVVHPEPGYGGCNYLSAGWADIYSVGTDCQWVDITDVDPGEYILQVAANPIGVIGEVDVENNIVQIPVIIPPDVPCQDQENCGDIADQDCDGRSDRRDPDCSYLYQDECCGAEDTCDWGYNRNCDCGGTTSWDYYDCRDEQGGNGGSGPSWEEGCCNEADSCNFANDSICDCNGEFDWDERDCSYDGGYGGDYGYYYYDYDDYDDYDDYYDYDDYPHSSTGSVSPDTH